MQMVCTSVGAQFKFESGRDEGGFMRLFMKLMEQNNKITAMDKPMKQSLLL